LGFVINNKGKYKEHKKLSRKGKMAVRCEGEDVGIREESMQK